MALDSGRPGRNFPSPHGAYPAGGNNPVGYPGKVPENIILYFFQILFQKKLAVEEWAMIFGIKKEVEHVKKILIWKTIPQNLRCGKGSARLFFKINDYNRIFK